MTTRCPTSSRTSRRSPCATRISSSPTCLGAAYEYLIKYFADSAGKKGGEFYTPAEVVRSLRRDRRSAGGHERLRPTRRLRRHADPVARVRRGVRRRPAQPGPLRPGEERHHLVHLQDEHAAAWHPARRHPPGRHHQATAAYGRRRRAAPLRPGARQSAVQPELHQEGHEVPRPLPGAGCRRRARRPT